jgi:agmatine deiminase
MIIDSEANEVYLSDCLAEKQPEFHTSFTKLLSELNIPVKEISGTKDIWSRDFMPVQVSKDKFVQFTYDPDYLRPEKYANLRSDPVEILQGSDFRVQRSTIILDGGNVGKGKDIALICDKVFHENPLISKNDLIRQLEKLLEVSRIVVLPWDRNDIIGHADGIARFLDDGTVLVNDYECRDNEYSRQLRKTLNAAGLESIPIPYNPYRNKTYLDATGIYINYLQMQQGIIFPSYGMKDDDDAIRQFERLFLGVTIRSVPSDSVAREGGVLNCVSWSILEKT